MSDPARIEQVDIAADRAVIESATVGPLEIALAVIAKYTSTDGTIECKPSTLLARHLLNALDYIDKLEVNRSDIDRLCGDTIASNARLRTALTEALGQWEAHAERGGAASRIAELRKLVTP